MHEEELLYDPQTSGGLLLALPASRAQALVTELTAAGVATAVIIGEVIQDSVGITVEA